VFSHRKMISCRMRWVGHVAFVRGKRNAINFIGNTKETTRKTSADGNILSRIRVRVTINEWVLDQMNRFIGSSPVVATIYYNTRTITVIVTYKVKHSTSAYTSRC
jgi:hypothetical protein